MSSWSIEKEREEKIRSRKGLLKESCPFCGNTTFTRDWAGGDYVGDGIFLRHSGNPGYTILTCKGCGEGFPDDGRKAEDGIPF